MSSETESTPCTPRPKRIPNLAKFIAAHHDEEYADWEKKQAKLPEAKRTPFEHTELRAKWHAEFIAHRDEMVKKEKQWRDEHPEESRAHDLLKTAKKQRSLERKQAKIRMKYSDLPSGFVKLTMSTFSDVTACFEEAKAKIDSEVGTALKRIRTLESTYLDQLANEFKA